MGVFKDMNIDQWIKIIINPREMLKTQGKEAKEFSLFAIVLCDQTWKNRNQIVWGNQPERLNQALHPNKQGIYSTQASLAIDFWGKRELSLVEASSSWMDQM